MQAVAKGVTDRFVMGQRHVELGAHGIEKDAPFEQRQHQASPEGPVAAVNELIDFMKNGPASAIVEEADVEFYDYTGEFSSFDIVR